MLTPRCCRLTWNARPSCARPVPHHVPRTRDLLLLLTPFPCSRGPGLEPFVATSLIQLLCRMTKLGWFEDDAYRGLADEARNFLEKGTAVSVGSYSTYCFFAVLLGWLWTDMCSLQHVERGLAAPADVHCLPFISAAGRFPGTLPAGPAHPEHAGHLNTPFCTFKRAFLTVLSCRAARRRTTCWACASSTCWSAK